MEAEAERATSFDIFTAAAVPFGKFRGECGALGVIPAHKPCAAPKSHRPCIVKRLVPLVLGILAKNSDRRAAHIFVDPFVVRAKRAPSRMPAVVLLHEIGIELPVCNEEKRLPLSRRRQFHGAAPTAAVRRRNPPPWRLRRGSSCPRGARRPGTALRQGSQAGDADRE